MQIKKQNLICLDDVEKSLTAFVFDFKNGHLKEIRSPISFIMKILKNGSTYISEHWEDPEDKLFLKQINLSKKKKAEKQRQLKEFFELQFEEWELNLLDSDKKKFSEYKDFMGELNGPMVLAKLKGYFRDNIYNGPPIKETDSNE